MIKKIEERKSTEKLHFLQKPKEKIKSHLNGIRNTTRVMCFLSLWVLWACWWGGWEDWNSSNSNQSSSIARVEKAPEVPAQPKLKTVNSSVETVEPVAPVDSIMKILDLWSIRIWWEYHVISIDSWAILFTVKDKDDSIKDWVIPFDFSDPRLKWHSWVFIKQVKNATNNTTSVKSEIPRSLYLSLSKELSLYDWIQKIKTEDKLLSMNWASSLVVSLMDIGKLSYAEAKWKVSKVLGIKDSEINSLNSSGTAKTIIYKLDVLTKMISSNLEQSNNVIDIIAKEVLYNINNDSDNLFSISYVQNICSHFWFSEEKVKLINIIFSYLEGKKITKPNEEKIEKLVEFYNMLIEKYEKHQIDQVTFENILSENPPESLNLKWFSVLWYFDTVLSNYYNQVKINTNDLDKDKPSISTSELIDKVLKDINNQLESTDIKPKPEISSDSEPKHPEPENNLIDNVIEVIEPVSVQVETVVDFEAETPQIPIKQTQSSSEINDQESVLPTSSEQVDDIDRSKFTESVLINESWEKKSIWIPNDQLWINYPGIKSAISEWYKYLNTEYRWVDKVAWVYWKEIKYRYQEKASRISWSNSMKKLWITDYRDHVFTWNQEYLTFEWIWVWFNIWTDSNNRNAWNIRRYLEKQDYFLSKLDEAHRERMIEYWTYGPPEQIVYNCVLSEYKEECDKQLAAEGGSSQSSLNVAVVQNNINLEENSNVNTTTMGTSAQNDELVKIAEDDSGNAQDDQAQQDTNWVILWSGTSMSFEFWSKEGEILDDQNIWDTIVPCDKVTDDIAWCVAWKNVSSYWTNWWSESSSDYIHNPLHISIEYGDKKWVNYPAKIRIDYKNNGSLEKTDTITVWNYYQKEVVKANLLRLVKWIQDVSSWKIVLSQSELGALHNELKSFTNSRISLNELWFESSDKILKLYLQYYTRWLVQWLILNDENFWGLYSQAATKLALDEIEKREKENDFTLSNEQKEEISEQITRWLMDWTIDWVSSYLMQYKDILDGFLNADIHKFKSYFEYAWSSFWNIWDFPKQYIDWFDQMKQKAFLAFNVIKEEILPNLDAYQKTYWGWFIFSSLWLTLYESSLLKSGVISNLDNYLDFVKSNLWKKLDFSIWKLDDLLRVHNEKMIIKKLSVPNGFKLAEQTRWNFWRVWDVVDSDLKNRLESIRLMSDKDKRWNEGEKFVNDLMKWGPKEFNIYTNWTKLTRRVDSFYELDWEKFIWEVKTYQKNVNVNTFIKDEIFKDKALEMGFWYRPVWYIIWSWEDIWAWLLSELWKNWIEFVIIKI